MFFFSILFLLCYYCSYFIVISYFFNFVHLELKFDQALNGYFDEEKHEIKLNISGLNKLSKYKNRLLKGKFEGIYNKREHNLIYLEDFVFVDPEVTDAYLNGYL